MDTDESLLRAILATMARGVFSPADIYKIIAPRSGRDKQVLAYNLCDGRTPQAEIVKKAGLDQGNLSRSLARWTDAGIVVPIGKQQYPMHVYPLTKNDLKTVNKED